MIAGTRAPGSAGPNAEPIPDWALEAWPGGTVAGRRAGWGFDHETWILERHGRRVIVQRRASGSDPLRPGAVAVRAAVRGAGLHVPEPATALNRGHRRVVVLPYVVGTPASELLGDRARAEVVGRLCGGVDARLAQIAPDGLRLLRNWAAGNRLRAAAKRWLAPSTGVLARQTWTAAVDLVETAAREIDDTAPRFTHGDLAPVNILADRGSVSAVLDLDRARLAHPLYDAAWFAWVVRHHHPEVADAAWRGFAKAAGLPNAIPTAFAWLQPLQLLERMAAARNRQERATWAARLKAALEDALEPENP